MKKVIITGIGGFVGAHVLEYFLEKTDWNIIGIDSFRHKGTYSRINEIVGYNVGRVKIFNHDLVAPIDIQLENQIIGKTLESNGKPVDYIINIASDSAVERSITDPGPCWMNNCNLMFNMLEFSRRVKPKLFLHFSTDEVYGEAAPDKAHHEWDVILPSNPYSASKAAQEALAISYWRTYDVPLLLLNVMNIIGEWQDKEKFLPKLIYKVATCQKMQIYGEPGKIGSRFYIHANNIADAIIYLSDFEPVKYGTHQRPDRYNVVGDMELDNLQMAQYVAKIIGQPLNYELIPSEIARRGYDKRYALDGSKLKRLGWKHPKSTLDSIEQIVKWTMEHPHWLV